MYLPDELPEKVKSVDLTTQNLYTLTDDSVKLIKQSETGCDTVCTYQQKTVRMIPWFVHWNNYEDESSHIKVEYVDPAVSPNFYCLLIQMPHHQTEVSLWSVAEKSKVIDASDLYEYSVDYSTYTQTKSAYDGEGQLTSAISYVTGDRSAEGVRDHRSWGVASLDSGFQSASGKNEHFRGGSDLVAGGC